jgi:hypothetical protein
MATTVTGNEWREKELKRRRVTMGSILASSFITVSLSDCAAEAGNADPTCGDRMVLPIGAKTSQAELGLTPKAGQWTVSQPALMLAGHFQFIPNYYHRAQKYSYVVEAHGLTRALLGDQGRRVDAYYLLAPLYARFTEGFDTRDLREAKALLGALRS